MPIKATHVERKRDAVLNVFCSPTLEGCRVHLNPAWAPTACCIVLTRI